MGRVIKILLLVLILAGLAYLGACVYANFFAFNAANPEADLPKAEKAPYVVVIENTGNMFFTAKYDQYGSTIILHGYWEQVGNKFQYRDRDLILDQAIYGTITVRAR